MKMRPELLMRPVGVILESFRVKYLQTFLGIPSGNIQQC